MQHSTVYVLYDRKDKKYYVGQTHQDLDARLQQHLQATWAGSRLPLHRAIFRAGTDNILLVRAEQVPRENAVAEEKRLIVEYGSAYPGGYNVLGSGTTSTLRRKRKLNKFQELIIEAYTQHGRSLAQLADFYGVAMGTVRQLLLRNGIHPRGRGRPRKANASA